MRGRSDLVALVLVTALTLGLLAAIAGRGFEAPELAAVSPVPSVTPSPGPTAGWWATLDLTPAPLTALPALPAPQLGGAAATAGAEIPFEAVACPGNGVTISRIATGQPGWWHIYGTAEIPGLAYWKAELSADGQGWTLLYRADGAVRDGQLMAFKTDTVPPGSYQLRLLAVDRTGNYPPPCLVRISTG